MMVDDAREHYIKPFSTRKETMPGQKTSVGTKKHRWMEMSYVPVSILGVRPDGEPATFPIGEPILGVSCFDCFIPVSAENMNGVCEAEPNPALK